MVPGTIPALDRRFGLGDYLRVGERDGHALVVITTPACLAEIAVQGAQVLRWQPQGQRDVLWCAPLPPAGSGKAIRGGIPVCWPWFGPHATDPALPQHGLVRTLDWTLTETALTEAGGRVAFALQSWNCALRLKIDLASTLTVALSTHNLAAAPVVITEALHTYFDVGDVNTIEIGGLDGCRYRDNTDGGCEKIQHGASRISGETIALFDRAHDVCTLDDPVFGRRITIQRTGGQSSILWNPGASATKLNDVPAGAQQHFVCLESGNIGSAAVTIAPGETHKLAVTYGVAPI